MIGIYFSGTGNTRHCVEKLVRLVDNSAISLPLEGDAAVAAISRSNVIFFGYGVRFSDMPYFVRDFINANKELWKDKNIFCIATTVNGNGGDGAGRSARLFKKYGATVLGGLHIRMPDPVCDRREKTDGGPATYEKTAAEMLKREKQLKERAELDRRLVAAADRKILDTAKEIRRGNYPQDGLGVLCGLGWSLRNRSLTKGYNGKLKIDEKLCDGCRICTELCPMRNLTAEDGKARASGKCTACYRCINRCPKGAITLVGDKIDVQYKIEKYL